MARLIPSLICVASLWSFCCGFQPIHPRQQPVRHPSYLYESSSSTDPRAPRRSAVSGKPVITTIHSVDDFADFLREDDRLCVIEYHAAWCKTCKKFSLLFQKIASEYGDLKDPKTGKIIEQGRVRFAQCEYGENRHLCKALGIKRLPSLEYYKTPVGKLDGFPCGPKMIGTAKEKLQHFLTRSPEELKFELDMKEGEALAKQVAQEAQQRQEAKEESKQKKHWWSF